jgi:hypothetical protein
MRNRRIALGAIIILIAVLLYFSYQNFKSIVVLKMLPTQTSIFAGSVDINVINGLRKPQSNGQISREQAIGLAELYCASVHSPPKQNPTNMEANLMTEKEAHIRLHDDFSGFSIKPVWLVSMDGMWEHEGPAPVPNETRVPLLFKHCNVIIDAKSGEMETVTN